METATDTVRVIAWRLLAPSTSGGKVYTIAVCGDRLFVAWGRADQAGQYEPGSQTKLEVFTSHTKALAAAMERTIAKESREYVMDIAPKALTVGKGIDTHKSTIRQVLRDGQTV